MKPGQQETQLFTQVVQLTRAVESNQKAIEEITQKLLLTATNLNCALLRLAITERIIKTRFGLTEQHIEEAAMDAIQGAKDQMEVEGGKDLSLSDFSASQQSK